MEESLRDNARGEELSSHGTRDTVRNVYNNSINRKKPHGDSQWIPYTHQMSWWVGVRNQNSPELNLKDRKTLKDIGSIWYIPNQKYLSGKLYTKRESLEYIANI